MKALFAALSLSVLLATAPALAAPSPSPKPGSLPIRGVTVDVQQGGEANSPEGASHVEMPPFAAPRQMRLQAPDASEAAPAARPARAKGQPAPSPSPSPATR